MSKVKAHSIKFVSCLLSMLIVISALGIKTNATVTVRDTTVDLYFINDEPAAIIGGVPSNLRTSYTINASGSSSGYNYRVMNSRNVQVSDTGVITPKKISTVYYSGSSTTVVERYYEGEATVRVTSKSDNSYTDIKVRTHDYSAIYASNRIQSIANSIKSQYSADADRINAITKYVAENYDYSSSYSSATSMVIYGGGDCLASTDLIIRIAQACGYQAWSRNGNRDPGAGSGHANALVQATNGTIYECEAGYSGSKPRYYYCKARDSLFSYYYYYDNGVKKVCIYQYDGQTEPANLVIPSSINGYPVSKIADSFIHSTSVTSITIPNTVTSIGNYAFSGCGITSLNIPASVTSIGNGIAAKCNSLTSLTVDANNPNYASVGNVIYNKDYTILITAPISSSVTIPGTVTEIHDYAFYYNPNITSITVPSTVTTIGEGAFGSCSNLSTINFSSGLTTIGAFAFNSSPISKLALPSTVTSVADVAFYGMNNVDIVLPTNIAPAVTAHSTDGIIRANSAIKIYIPANATGFDSASWTDTNITFIRSDNPYAEVFPSPTNTPTPTNTNTPTPTPVPVERIDGGVTSFVERLYTIAHNRTCDISGRDYWVNSIIANGKTGGEVARLFFFSTEFNNRSANMSNEEFLQVVYRTFFDRAGDPGGINYFLNLMANGMTKGEVINSFINSQEWANLCLRYGIRSGGNKASRVCIIPSSEVIEFVTRFYVSFLGRQPDTGGLNNWSYQLANLNVTGRDLAYRFTTSQEYLNRNLSNEEFLNTLYSGFMGRAPDASGYNYHLQRLNNGVSRNTIINDFASSTEFRNICIRYGILR